MNILSRLLLRNARRPPRPPRRPLDWVDADPGPVEAPLRGCGWFDSSHELQCGLSVREHASPDDVAAELPLAAWLELHLSGWQARPRA